MFLLCILYGFFILVDSHTTFKVTLDQAMTRIHGSNWQTVRTCGTLMNSQALLADLFYVQQWDVSDIDDFSHMFASCSLPTAWNWTFLETWNMTSATDLQNMFIEAQLHTSTLDLSNWDVSNVEYFNNMFTETRSHCDGNWFGVDGWNMTSASSIQNMFRDNKKLTSQNCDNYDFTSMDTWDETLPCDVVKTNAFKQLGVTPTVPTWYSIAIRPQCITITTTTTTITTSTTTTTNPVCQDGQFINASNICDSCPPGQFNRIRFTEYTHACQHHVPCPNDENYVHLLNDSTIHPNLCVYIGSQSDCANDENFFHPTLQQISTSFDVPLLINNSVLSHPLDATAPLEDSTFLESLLILLNETHEEKTNAQYQIHRYMNNASHDDRWKQNHQLTICLEMTPPCGQSSAIVYEAVAPTPSSDRECAYCGIITNETDTLLGSGIDVCPEVTRPIDPLFPECTMPSGLVFMANNVSGPTYGGTTCCRQTHYGHYEFYSTTSFIGWAMTFKREIDDTVYPIYQNDDHQGGTCDNIAGSFVWHLKTSTTTTATTSTFSSTTTVTTSTFEDPMESVVSFERPEYIAIYVVSGLCVTALIVYFVGRVKHFSFIRQKMAAMQLPQSFKKRYQRVVYE